MAQWIEFISNHYLLVAAFFIILGALLVTESRKSGQGVSPQAAVQLMNKSNAVVLDVRSVNEFKEGHIVDAMNIPFAELSKRLGELDAYRSLPIIVICAIGQHSGMAGRQLTDAGFEHVIRLSGGISSWRAASLPVIK
jgi:rhodanese-related sulfurtransferase